MPEIPFVGKFLETSLLGTLLLLSLIVIYVLFKLLMQEKDARLTDSKAVNDLVISPMREVKEQVQLQNSLLTQFLAKK